MRHPLDHLPRHPPEPQAPGALTTGQRRRDIRANRSGSAHPSRPEQGGREAGQSAPVEAGSAQRANPTAAGKSPAHPAANPPNTAGSQDNPPGRENS